MANVAYSDIIAVTFSFETASWVGNNFNASGMTANHVCCDTELPVGAYQGNGGIKWTTKANEVYIGTADQNTVDSSMVNKEITLHFGIPINS